MPKLEKTARDFRRDINGLRAWAVISVILYHFGISGFSGGFVGVDIFFVISGFLMSSIIISGLESTSNFSIFKFYLARAKRIIPALLILCLAITIPGWLYLSDIEYKTLAHHIISAITFSSNISFWKEAGYFDAVSYDKWLLHTWSLSLEWQFYLILPIALVALWKLRPGRASAFGLISLAFAASFIASTILSTREPSAAFYLLPTRAWEMLAGGITFFVTSRYTPSPRARTPIELTGFALIIYSITTISPSTVWPGWQAIFPVTGTVLVIIAAKQNSYLTSTPPAQWIGNWSYSLYLWHWPIAAALVYLEFRTSSPAIIMGLCMTLILGYLSYRLIEKSSRNVLGSFGEGKSFGFLVLAVAITLAPSFLILKNDGFPNRAFAKKSEFITTEGSKKNPRAAQCFAGGRAVVPECTYGGEELGAIVIGDSHAAATVRSVERALPNKNLHVLDWSLMSCATISGLQATGDENYRCANFLEYALKKQLELPSSAPIIIINRTSAYLLGPNEPHRFSEIPVPQAYITKPYSSRSPEFLEEMRNGIINTACELAKTRPVYMVRPIPEMKLNVPKTMIRRLSIPGDHGRVSLPVEEYMQRNSFVWRAQDDAAKECGIHILDPTPYLCNERQCFGDKNGIPLFYDDNHLNEHGDDELVPMFSKVFEAIEHKPSSTEANN